MQNLWMYFLVVLATCVTPGAGVLMTVSNAFRYGKKHAFVSPVGNAFGVLCMSVVSATGLGGIITATPELFYGMQALGALVLVYFGFKSWRAKSLDLSLVAQTAANRPHQETSIFWGAASLQVTNPMLLVFLISLMPPFVDPKADYVSTMAVLIGILVATCLAVHLVYSYTACLAGRFLRGARFGWWLNHISAVLFWLIAAGVAASMIEKFAA